VTRLTVSVVRLGVVVVVAVAAVPAGSSAARVMLRWRASGRIDNAPLTGLACPSSSLCVAGDTSGRLIVSTKPTGAAARWRAVELPAVLNVSIGGISCPSVHLCGAIDSAGDVITSTNPASLRAWRVTRVDNSGNYNGGPELTGVSCPSRSLCVVVDNSGNAITSTNPSQGASAWTLHRIDSGIDYGCYHYNETGPQCIPGLVAVSCATTTKCVAIDWAGGILTTHDPTGTAGWGGGQQPASSSFDELACPSSRACLLSQLYSGQIFLLRRRGLTEGVNLDPSGVITGLWCEPARICFATTQPNTSGTTRLLESVKPTAPRPAWKHAYTPPHPISAISCPSANLCLAAQDNDIILVGTRSNHRR